VLVHLFRVEIRYKKTDIISLIEIKETKIVLSPSITIKYDTYLCLIMTHLNGLSPENNKVLSSHHHEPHELVTQNLFDFIGLLDCYTNSD